MPETFFLRGADCWGWATWRDKWKDFRIDADNMLREIEQKGLAYKFNLKGNVDYCDMLYKRSIGRNNSWAICWHASCFLMNRVTLHPGRSLVQNIGLDFSGENCAPSSIMASNVSNQSINVEFIPPKENINAFRIYADHYSSNAQRKLMSIVLFLKQLPLLRKIKTFFAPSRLHLEGSFSSFHEAEKNCSGYSDSIVLDKVYSAVKDVLNGYGTYERDGTVFSPRPKNLRLTHIFKSILQEYSIIVDYGGGLGGSYINHRDIIPETVDYYVVEQPNFVERGRQLASDFNLPLTFSSSLSNIPNKIDLVILSGLLQYVPNPYSILSEVLILSPQYLLIDRTSFSNDHKWKLQVNDDYYSTPVNYPFRSLNYSSFSILCQVISLSRDGKRF